MTRLAGTTSNQRTIEPPTVQGDGIETHPAWGMIAAHRVTSTPGSVLFDSEIRHQHYVTIKVSTASRERDLNRDWLHPQREFVEVAMSEAQWASFVSSMNAGSGVPCTITRRESGAIPGFPYAPRMEESMAEVRGAADRAANKIAEAFAKYEDHRTAENRRNLRAAIVNASPNVAFAAKSLTEHAENVVQKARADIEAMVIAKAQQLGLDPAAVASPLELTAGPEED